MMGTVKPRFTIVLDAELIQRIDDFRFDNRYPSRSAATVELIQWGLEAFEKRKNEAMGKNSAADEAQKGK